MTLAKVFHDPDGVRYYFAKPCYGLMRPPGVMVSDR